MKYGDEKHNFHGHEISVGSDLKATTTSGSEEVRHRYDSEDTADNRISRPKSRYSENSIYGDADETTVALERQTTRATVASKAGQSSLYKPQTHIDVEGLDTIPAGEEFENEDPELVTWEGPNDPENPRNWSQSRKHLITMLASLQTLLVTLSTSILTPAIPNILETYNNSNLTVGSLIVSIMVLLWSFTAIMWAPLAEVVGRRRVMIVSAAGNLAFNIACAVSPTTATMLVFRALTGAFSSAPVSISAGSLADVYDDEKRQWPLAIWSLGPACGPGLAPVIGGFIAQYTTWRWVFWVTVIIQGVSLGLLAFFFEETYPQILLQKKCWRLKRETNNPNLHTIWDLTTVPVSIQVKVAILRPVLFLLLNPVVLLLAVYLAFTYGFMYLILTNLPSLWTDIYHYTKSIGGLMYLAYSLGMMIGVLLWTTLINWRCRLAEKRGDESLEQRLFWLPLSTVILAGGMFWYGWSAEAKLPWPMPCVGIGLFGFALFCVFQSVQSYVVGLNARLAGSAISACVLGRCILGGTFPLFGKAMYDRLGYGWASTVVALLAIALGVPWPIGIYFYGARLRAWTDANIHIH